MRHRVIRQQCNGNDLLDTKTNNTNAVNTISANDLNNTPAEPLITQKSVDNMDEDIENAINESKQ